MFMTKLLRYYWSNFGIFWLFWPNLFPNLNSWAWILRRILRELFTLFLTVYWNIYVYDQIFEISLVKVWRKMGIWRFFFKKLHVWDLILKRILRELWTLFPTVYISLYFYIQIFLKIWSKWIKNWSVWQLVVR